MCHHCKISKLAQRKWFYFPPSGIGSRQTNSGSKLSLLLFSLYKFVHVFCLYVLLPSVFTQLGHAVLVTAPGAQPPVRSLKGEKTKHAIWNAANELSSGQSDASLQGLWVTQVAMKAQWLEVGHCGPFCTQIRCHCALEYCVFEDWGEKSCILGTYYRINMLVELVFQ